MVLLKFGICGSFRGNGQDKVLSFLFCFVIQCSAFFRISETEKRPLCSVQVLGGLSVWFLCGAKAKSERGGEEMEYLSLFSLAYAQPDMYLET